MPTIRTAAGKTAKLTPTEADANMKRTPVEKTADYTLDATHNREFHYLTTSVATVTLPDISAITIETGDWEITLYNTLSTSVTIASNSQNINGAASNLTLAPGQVVTICADATPDAFYTKTFKDPTTTRGDMMVRGASSLSRLAVGSAGNVQRSDGTDPAWDDAINAATVGAVSGTTIEITDIPAWAKRITIITSNLSTSGTSDLRLLIGDSGGLETSGYTSNNGYYGPASQDLVSSTDGFVSNKGVAADAVNQIWTLMNVSGNLWVCSMNGTSTGNFALHTAGSKTLTGTLTHLQLTTVSPGTDTFDAGSIQVYYE